MIWRTFLILFKESFLCFVLDQTWTLVELKKELQKEMELQKEVQFLKENLERRSASEIERAGPGPRDCGPSAGVVSRQLFTDGCASGPPGFQKECFLSFPLKMLLWIGAFFETRRTRFSTLFVCSFHNNVCRLF